MKRFTAILAVLCLLFAAVACNGGRPAVTTPQSTAAQNTTENPKTESTTSQTEASKIPEKPVLSHPAIEEINEGVEKTLALDNYCAVVISDMFPTYTGGGAHPAIPQYTHGQTLTVANAGSESPVFSLETKTRTPSYNSGKELPDKNVYFDGESYYVSYMGVNAKVAGNGMSSTPSPKEFILPLLAKLPADTAEPVHSVQKDYSIYEIELEKSEANTVLAELRAALARKVSAAMGSACEVGISSATVTITVDTEGYITDYNIEFSASIMLGGEHTASYKLNSRIETTFVGIGHEHVPAAPENPGSYTALENENDILLAMFNSAAGAVNGLGSATIYEETTVNRKELTGSNTEIKVSRSKSYAGKGDALTVRESTVTGINGGEFERHEVYFKEGFFYVEETGTKYTPEDFEKLYGGIGSYAIPSLPWGSALSAQVIYESDTDSSWAPISFKMSEEAFAAAFAERIDAAARTVAGKYDIWKYSVSNASFTGIVNKAGYLTALHINFSIEVIVDINGAKFAFSAAVESSVYCIDLGTEAEIPPLQGYENYKEYKQ